MFSILKHANATTRALSTKIATNKQAHATAVTATQAPSATNATMASSAKAKNAARANAAMASSMRSVTKKQPNVFASRISLARTASSAPPDSTISHSACVSLKEPLIQTFKIYSN